MADSVQNIRKRIKSVSSINKITKAMEMVAATKMRRAQEIALASRPYAFAALDLLAHLSLRRKKTSEFLVQRPIKKVLFVIVSSDKGLAGALNNSVFRKFESHIRRDREKYKNEEKLYMAIGEKAFQYLSKNNYNVVEKFPNSGDHAEPEQVNHIADAMAQGYLSKKWDRVIISSMHFKSALKQEPHIRKILPIDFDSIRETIEDLVPQTGKFADMIKTQNINFISEKEMASEHLVEPSEEEVLDILAKHLLFMKIYHLILESNASEHSARRLAMKTASDNASDLGEKLNLQYNKARQAGITNQIIEISAGAEAMS